MDRPWLPPPPMQGNPNSNICPTCSISHFPFCPPHPHPSRFPGSTFEPNMGPPHLGRPVYHNSPDPYYDPGHWNNMNSNLPPQLGDHGSFNRGSYNNNNNHGYVGSECSGYNNANANANDGRSSKRLRVDGVYPALYPGECDVNLSNSYGGGNERRPNPGFGYDRGVRGYGQESSGFDRNVEGRDREYGSGGGIRPPSNVEMEYGSHYWREEVGYGVGHGVKRGALDVEHDRVGDSFRGYDHQVGHYGQVAKPPDPGSFHHGGAGYDNDRMLYGHQQPNYGSDYEQMRMNDAAVPYEQRSSMPTSNQYSSSRPPFPNTAAQPGHMGYDYHAPRPFHGVRPQFEARPPSVEGYQGSLNNNNVPSQPHVRPPHMDKAVGYGNSVPERMGHFPPPQGFDVWPPLPASPPPPLPMEPPTHWPTEQRPSPKASSSLFPVPASSPALVHSSHAPIPQSHAGAIPSLPNSQVGYASHSTFQGDPHATLSTFGQYPGGNQHFLSKISVPEKPKTVDVAHLFKPPHRTSRPDHFVIILRGLPGSGKSYLAKMLRDLEVEHGGNAPRIHSMDDYFMTEVEKSVENEASKPSVRGKKSTTKKVLEFCYEPEMEEAYRSSMLKAFKKTLEEGAFTFVIVDDRNLRVADFAQFWATAKRSGYEAYVLEAPYKDPVGCTARNVHGFTQDDVEKMSAVWEETPSLYLQLDSKCLFHGDDLRKSNIQEVDMDTEDGDFDTVSLNLDKSQAENTPFVEKYGLDGTVSKKDVRYSDAEAGNATEEVKYLGRSKWSDRLDDIDDEKTEMSKDKANVLSGLLGTYGKEGKFVHWGDQGALTGFSIGAVKKANLASLVIGPGAGYNLKSNPLPKEDAMTGKSGETKKHCVFQERLRAEQESFRAVFDKRRHRIGGVLAEEN